MARLAEHLNAGQPARTVPDREEIFATAEIRLLTDKPEVYLANADEDDAAAAEAVEKLAPRVGGQVVPLTGKLESDLAELDDAERPAFAAEMGLSSSGMERVVRACYEALGLLTFFTGVGAEARAWAVPRGTPLAAAAGRIHTDMERGFIRAEVIGFGDLDRLGSWQEAHRTGHVRTEGRDYPLQEGDVILVRFNA